MNSKRMHFIYLFLIILFNQHSIGSSHKKPILNETKILENHEYYERLLKQYLNSSTKLNLDKEEIKKYNSPKKLFSLRDFKRPKLLVIGLDGFRYDYVDLYNARTFKKLQNRGVYAKEGLIPMFCTKTFPNFFSLSTGLYQEVHGIVDNYFKDSKINRTFDIYSKKTHEEKFWFTEAEPIWLTANKQGKRIGSCQWPATDSFNELLSEFIAFDTSFNFSKRLDLSYEWLFEKDLDLVLTYFHQPDETGHNHGPFSRQVHQEINLIDNELSKFIDRLDSTNSLDQFNVLIVSDHGMSFAKDLNYKIYLSDYIDVRNIEVVNEGAVVQIYAKLEQINDIFQKLKYSNQPFKVYRKEDLPLRFHYGYLNRLGSLIVMADEGYQIFKDKQARPYTIGSHGWDNNLYSMRPIFYGFGSNLKPNFNINKAFETINLYNLMCKLLNLNPAPNNGTMSFIEPFLV